MKKNMSIFFIFMLIAQSLLSSVGFSNSVKAESPQEKLNINKVSYIGEDGVEVNPSEYEGAISVRIDWSAQNNNITPGDETIVALTVENGIELTGAQTGELEFEGKKVANYNTDAKGNVSVLFTDGVEEIEAEKMTGSFTLKGNISIKELGNSEESDTNGKLAESNEQEQQDESSEQEKEDEDSEQPEIEVTSDNDKSKEDESKSESEEEGTTSEDKMSHNTLNALPLQTDENEKQGFTLKLDQITDLDDNEFAEQNPMDPYREFKLKLSWQLSNGHTYTAGDTVTFDLPKGIKVTDTISIEVKDEDGQVLANAIITPDKKVTLTFTDFLTEHSNVNGWMEIISKLDLEEVEVEDGKAIIDPIGDEGELRIPIDEGNKDKTIEKSGEPNKGYNADEINWEVIVNKNKTSLTDALVTDVLPEGTEYKEGSLVVTKLKLDLNGNITGDLETVEITPEVNENGELIIPLGNISDAYRIEYVTTVTDDDAKEFENNATLTDAELEDVSANSTITINRGEPLKKSIVWHNRQTNTLAWEVQFNYNQKDLSNITLKDTWTPENTLEFVEGSLTFQEVSIDAEGNVQNVGDPIALLPGADVQPISDGFEVTGITTNKAYKITYQTKITDRVLVDGFNVINTVSFDDKSVNSGVYIHQNYGIKSAGEIDYVAKTIEWTININNDEWPMEKIRIEDTLGEGLTLLEDSISITVNGDAYTGDYTLSGDNPFNIVFPEDFKTDKRIVIAYKTKFDADNVPDQKPENKVAITWTPEGESDSITKEVGDETELNQETKDNSWKNGSYNPVTKEITWEIIANYRENDIANLIIKDAPEGNQQIIAGSAVVKELYIAKDGEVTEGDTVKDVATIDEDANTLEVNIGKTNKAYKIIYKTSLADLDNMQNEYVNEAEIFDGADSLSEIDAKVGIVKDYKYGHKFGEQDGKKINWTIEVNLVQQKVQGLKLEDSITDNQEYLEDSIKVYHAIMDTDGNVSRGEEVPTSEYDLTVNETEFTIDWKNTVEHAFIVDYSTLFFEKHNGTVGNDYKITGDSISENDQDASDSSSVTISQLGSGGGEGTAGYLIIKKIDAEDREKILPGAKFDLIDVDTGSVLKSGTTNENGEIDFGRLLFGDYKLKETGAPEGYVLAEEEYEITIDKQYKPGDNKIEFEYTVENNKFIDPDEKITILGTKTWIDNDSEDRPTSIIVQVKNGEDIVQEQNVTADGKWTYEFTDLPKYDGDKNVIKYEVVEIAVPGYRSEVDGFNLTNTRVGETEVSGTKTWKDGDSKNRPASITVNLLQNGTVIDSKEVAAETDWAYSFTDLSVYDAEGVAYEYTISEVDVPGYQSEVDGFDITNTRTDVKSIEITKAWLDNDSADRPSDITVELFRSVENGEKKLVDTFTVTAENDWKQVVENLPSFNKDGQAYVYEIAEEKVAGYETEINGFNITNVRVGETEVSGTKTWKDNDSKNRPASITVNLLQNGTVIDSKEVTVETDWAYSFTDLAVYDAEGVAYEYTISEVDVPGYQSEVDGFDITNTRTDVKSIEITKAWLDNDSADRSSEITVELFRSVENGEKELVDTFTVTAENDWKLLIENLPSFNKDGQAYVYEIEEAKVDGYETSINGFDITNIRVGETAVEGTKTWKDGNSVDRPESITVNLLQNGTVIDSKEVTAETDWAFTFEQLAAFDANGVAYEYTISEVDVPGYQSEVDGFDITNTRTDVKSIEITKAWLDNDSTDRPSEITVELFRSVKNGEKKLVDTFTVMAENDWKQVVENLPTFNKDGQAYMYEIEEVSVDGYETIIDGFDITNLRVGKTSVEGTKTWKGDSPSYRPKMIKVDLLQNGEVIDTVEVTAETDWVFNFTDLDEFDVEGKAYTYTIEEQFVSGYRSVVDGYNITNILRTVDTVDPEKPGEPGDNNNNGSVSPLSGNKPGSGNTNNTGKLPQTGEEQFMYMIALGTLFLAIGAIVLFRQRRRA